MVNNDVEISLLFDYLKAAGSASDPHEAERTLSLFRKQLSRIEELDLLTDNIVSDYRALAYRQEAINLLQYRHRWADGSFNTKTSPIKFESAKYDALAAANKAVEISPENSNSRLLRASVNAEMQKYSDALEDIQYVLSNSSDNNAILQARKLHDQIQLDAKKKTGPCFIATAAYGSLDAPEVRILRQLRDEILSHSTPGRVFIGVYYRLSPRLADMLRRSPVGREIVRKVLLTPFVRFAEHTIRRRELRKSDETSYL